MADCSAETLLDNAKCLECAVPPGLVPFASLYLLCQIHKATVPGADCSASALVDNAKCLECGVPPGLVQFAALYLLCQIKG